MGCIMTAIMTCTLIIAIHITHHFLSVQRLHRVIAVHILGGMGAVVIAIDVPRVLKLA